MGSENATAVYHIKILKNSAELYDRCLEQKLTALNIPSHG